jgi:hypothetical protein
MHLVSLFYGNGLLARAKAAVGLVAISLQKKSTQPRT